MRATNNLPIGAVLQLIFTEKQTGAEYTFMVFDDGVGLYDNDNEEYIWRNRGLT